MRLKSFSILLSSMIIVGFSNAQICQGSLGDPIINITFGQGANPGPILSAATTNYQYVSTDCPSDGFYTVRNSCNACFGNTWHSVSSDHTGDPNGYSMLVNASFQPSAFYLDTVRGLCSSTTYEFAAWIMNLNVPSACSGNTIQPNITFSIERTNGTVLQTYNTGNIAASSTPTWKQYGFFFTVPVAVSDIVLRIFNNSQGGCGNDLALDDITFRPCGPQITNTIDALPVSTDSVCEGPGHTYFLSCTLSGGFSNPTFLWQVKSASTGDVWVDQPSPNGPSAGYYIFSNSLPGIYQARLVVAEFGNITTVQCRVYSQPFTFFVKANPVTTVSNDGPACVGNILTLNASGGTKYEWNGPIGFTGIGSPLTLSNIQFSQAGKYYVIVTNAAGCKKTDSTIVIVNPSPTASTGFTNTSICLKDSVQLMAAGGLTYQWIPAAGLNNATVFDPKASPSNTIQYCVVVTDQFNCRDTAYITVNVRQKPGADAGSDKTILEGMSVQLNGSVTGQGNGFTWSPQSFIDDIHSVQPIVNPPSDASYILNVTSNFGCGTASDTMNVKVFKNIFIPNAFSPNGDGNNDTWNIPALAAYPFFEVNVYNRYGQLVFHTKNTQRPWDGTFKGKPLPVGVYCYFINLGINRDLIKGTLLIIR